MPDALGGCTLVNLSLDPKEPFSLVYHSLSFQIFSEAISSNTALKPVKKTIKNPKNQNHCREAARSISA